MNRIRLENKAMVHELSKMLYGQTSDSIGQALSAFIHRDAVWNGPHPIHRLCGFDEIVEKFYKPLFTSFPDLEKRDDMLLGGVFEGNLAEWVSTKGNIVATFEQDFLGIPATKGVVYLRYGEFHRIADKKIVETYLILDLLDLMRQAGILIVPSMGVEIPYPAPATMDGIRLGQADEEESAKTLQLVERMLFQGLREDYEAKGVQNMGMEQYFQKDFMWYGPGGTGVTRGVKGFMDYHTIPFCNGIPDWKCGNHITRYAEDQFCSFVGWPSIYATHTGSTWLGLPATGKKITMRVMDFYRREGDMLTENWVYIDMLDFLYQIGVDPLERIQRGQQYFHR